MNSTAIGAVLSSIPGAKGAQRSCPAGSMAKVGLRWCGGSRDKPNGGSRWPNQRKSDQSRYRQSLFLLQLLGRDCSGLRGRSADPGSKQARVIAMLQSPAGATIAAMMDATGWQQHSVRGFLAGVVRKRLKLTLSSKKVDGNRVYQIAGTDRGKVGPRPSKRRSR